MARDERIFKSPKVLKIYQITTVIYIQLRNDRIKIKSNVRAGIGDINVFNTLG